MDRPARKRVLIEASKLADAKMDGIKRYVVELLRAYIGMGADSEFLIDVLVRGKIYTLATLSESGLLGVGFDDGTSDGARPQQPRMPSENAGVRETVLRAIGVCLPPFFVGAAGAMIPDALSPALFGKPKSELRLLHASPGAKTVSMLVPPIVLHAVLRWASLDRVIRAWRTGWFELPALFADADDYDLVHVTLPNNTHYVPLHNRAAVVTVHDLSHIECPQFQSHANSVTLAIGLERALRFGARLIADSDATRVGLLAGYSVDPANVATVHLACADEVRKVDDSEAMASVRRRYGLPEGRFLLTLSTIEPRKNLAAVMQAYGRAIAVTGRADVSLVVAGAQGWGNAASAPSVAVSATADGHVHLTGYVDDADLPALYSAADGFVYASHYEGFGLPLLEAMRCGTAVVYGDNSSMPEVVGEAGLPADSRDVESISRQIVRLIEDPDLARRLGAIGLERSRQFTSRRMAEETIAQYRVALGGS